MTDERDRASDTPSDPPKCRYEYLSAQGKLIATCNEPEENHTHGHDFVRRACDTHRASEPAVPVREREEHDHSEYVDGCVPEITEAVWPSTFPSAVDRLLRMLDEETCHGEPMEHSIAVQGAIWRVRELMPADPTVADVVAEPPTLNSLLEKITDENIHAEEPMMEEDRPYDGGKSCTVDKRGDLRCERPAFLERIAELERSLSVAQAMSNDVLNRAIDKITALQAELRAALRERDLARAHDTQPYPTAWAYEQVCAALKARDERDLENRRQLAAQSEEIERLKRLIDMLDNFSSHANDCSISDIPAYGQTEPMPCSCGLAAVWDEIEPDAAMKEKG